MKNSQLTPASASSKLTPSISKSNSGSRNSSLQTVGFGGGKVAFGGSGGRANEAGRTTAAAAEGTDFGTGDATNAGFSFSSPWGFESVPSPTVGAT